MQDLMNNMIQIFNEVVILFCTWSLFLFTDYVPSPEQRYEYGQSYLYFIGFNFTVNILVLVWIVVSGLIRSCRQKYASRSQKKRSQIQNHENSSEESSDQSIELTHIEKRLLEKSWEQRAREFH